MYSPPSSLIGVDPKGGNLKNWPRAGRTLYRSQSRTFQSVGHREKTNVTEFIPALVLCKSTEKICSRPAFGTK